MVFYFGEKLQTDYLSARSEHLFRQIDRPTAALVAPSEVIVFRPRSLCRRFITLAIVIDPTRTTNPAMALAQEEPACSASAMVAHVSAGVTPAKALGEEEPAYSATTAVTPKPAAVKERKGRAGGRQRGGISPSQNAS